MDGHRTDPQESKPRDMKLLSESKLSGQEGPLGKTSQRTIPWDVVLEDKNQTPRKTQGEEYSRRTMRKAKASGGMF